MKAIIQFFSTGSGTAALSASKVIEGKDLRIHMDAPSAYHITDAYHNHKLVGAYSGVESIELEGKPKQRKPKPAETLTIEVDTSKLQMCIKEAMLELEALVKKGDLVHKEDIDDDYLDRNCSPEVLAQYGVTAARAERDQLEKEIVELRLAIEQLAFVPPDVATAAQLLDAELLIFLDQSKKFPGPDANQDIHYANGLRFAIGKLTGNPVPFAQVPYNPSAKPAPMPPVPFSAPPLPPMPMPASEPPETCTCPPKRNIIDRGHLSYCPAYEGKADCEGRPVKC